jgi:hypothetical protein
MSDLRIAVADAIAAGTWNCDHTCIRHGEDALLAADAAIAAVLDHIIERAEHQPIVEFIEKREHLVDWLRSFREAGQ